MRPDTNRDTSNATRIVVEKNNAAVVELVDALDSKSSTSNSVSVRVRPAAQIKITLQKSDFVLLYCVYIVFSYLEAV